MSFAFDSDLEPLEDEVAEETGDEYGGYFDEIDFAAMGLNPATPTDAKPGSDDKVLMLAARYAAGLPLWHNEDRYDHGPGQLEVLSDGQTTELIVEEDE